MNWNRTRSFFPVTRNLVYLNHAGVAPISTRVDDALRRYADEALQRGAFDYSRVYDAEIERVRGRLAELLGAGVDEVAFVKNTTQGLGCVAGGLDWQEGDQVLTCDLEYPSNVYPWWSLRSRGVETRMLPGRDGALPLERVAEALRGPRVRLLSVSSVQYGSGFRADLAALGKLCRESGVLFCVDAIQSLGCLPLDVEACSIDFLAADGHKWMLGPEGAGVFYCSRRVMDRLTPQTVGWRSVVDNHDFDHYHSELQAGAGRFEEGTPNTAGIYGLGAAVDLLLELGIEAIGERVLGLSRYLGEELRARGAELRSPRGPGEASGIVSFTMPYEAPEATARRLRRRHVFTVVRRSGVRASPHFYNTREELDQLLEVL